jgi:membrane protein implicated in regulation of membrane protease activity
MPAWLVWLIVAAVLGIAELFTLSLVLGLIAGGALLASLVAALGAGLAWQVFAFLAGSSALLLLVRPLATRHLATPAAVRTGVAALEGATGVVVSRVDANSGRVKLNGEVWSARALESGAVLEVGDTVAVHRIDGATAVVYGSEIPWRG